MIDIKDFERNIKSIDNEIENLKSLRNSREETINLIKNFSKTTLDIMKDLETVKRSTLNNEIDQAVVIDKHIKNLLFTKKLEEIIE